MLTLTLADLSKRTANGKPGVRVWWERVQGRKKKAMHLAWDDLALLDARVRWPEEFSPFLEPAWGRASLRVTWVKGLARIVTQDGVPVPSFSSVRTCPESKLTTLDLHEGLRPAARSVFMHALEDPEGDVAWLTEQVVERITSHAGYGLLWQAVDGTSMVLAKDYSGAVRAVATALRLEQPASEDVAPAV